MFSFSQNHSLTPHNLKCQVSGVLQGLVQRLACGAALRHEAAAAKAASQAAEPASELL